MQPVSLVCFVNCLITMLQRTLFYFNKRTAVYMYYKNCNYLKKRKQLFYNKKNFCQYFVLLMTIEVLF